MKIILILSLVLVSILMGSCASGHREPFANDTPVVRALQPLATELEVLCSGSALLKLQEAGRVNYEGFEAPIWVVRYRPPGAVQRVLILGGVHGNEPAGSAWVVEFIALISGQPLGYGKTAFDIVPLVNPWGWSRNKRFNREGLDINRDFATFETQEAGILRQIFSNGTYDLVIDHHEDPDASGFYLYQYGKRDATVSREVIARIRGLGYPIEQDVRMVILRTRDGLIDAPGWGIRYMRLSRQLSLTNYLRLEHSREVYTIETPMHLPIEERLRMHRRAFETIYERVLQ